MAHPLSHGGPIQIDALTGIDAALTMQRQAVGVFCHGDMSEQARARPAAFDRQRRRRRLHDRLAGPAAQLRPHVLYHLERGRNVFEHLGQFLGDLAQHRAAAAAAGALRRVRYLLAR